MGRWLSGRKRRTVDLLGNSHWFESNPSQLPANFSLSLRKFKYNFQPSLTKRIIDNLRSQNASQFMFLAPKVRSFFSLKKPVLLKGYNARLRKFHNTSKALSLNFTRGKFFPVIRELSGSTYFFLSLGLLAKFLLKGKSFTKSKTVYLLLANFLRKVLLFSSVNVLLLLIKNTPRYLREIMATLNDPVINVYSNPFSEHTVLEKNLVNPFTFSAFIFTQNKPYGLMKVKQRGRLKRKITKRLIAAARVLD